jgi:hypothetical protein
MQKLTELKRDTDKSIITVLRFSTPLPIIDRRSGKLVRI